MDVDRARRIRHQWQRLAAEANLRPFEELYELVAPALGWLEDEDRRQEDERRYEQAVARVEAALDDPETALQKLERLGFELEKLGREIPEPLATRYRNRVAALQLAERRGRILRVGSIAAGIGLVLALIVSLLYVQVRAGRIASVAEQVEAMI
ncbi:MAG TPA: hypothetical protein EYP14_10130 [Planctomycetaceae bacterium]|nr:hypothetical protein [Planctomycetaceae bacterium]